MESKYGNGEEGTLHWLLYTKSNHQVVKSFLFPYLVRLAQKKSFALSPFPHAEPITDT